MSRLFPLFACLLLALLAGRARATTENYQRGVAAFEKKDWPAAREAFESVIEKDQMLSNDLLFNLGNTLFREEKPGLAALWYRRALLLDPRDPAARQNLRLIQRRTGALEFATSPGRTLAASMKHRHWRWALAGAAWTGVLAAAALVFLRLRGAARGWAWLLLALSAPATAIAAWGASARLDPGAVSRRAIVTQTEAAALAAPTDTAGLIIDLPPATEVIVRESRETWSYIEVPGDQARVGWVRTRALTPLWPYSPALIE
jgi:tetratricopeptide (TPR) repeat protein